MFPSLSESNLFPVLADAEAASLLIKDAQHADYVKTSSAPGRRLGVIRQGCS